MSRAYELTAEHLQDLYADCSREGTELRELRDRVTLEDGNYVREDLEQLEQRLRILTERLRLARLYFDMEHRWQLENKPQQGGAE